MTCSPHDWKPTGERDIHVDITYKRTDGRHDRCLVDAIYVRCARCRQWGYRNGQRPESRVVYTWSQI